jgi:hypothetical protein
MFKIIVFSSYYLFVCGGRLIVALGNDRIQIKPEK